MTYIYLTIISVILAGCDPVDNGKIKVDRNDGSKVTEEVVEETAEAEEVAKVEDAPEDGGGEEKLAPEDPTPVKYSCDLSNSTWTTVDTFQLTPGKESTTPGLGFGKNGNVFYAGRGLDATDVYRAFVRRSKDEGKTWDTVDNFQLANGFASSTFAFQNDKSGNLYIMGRYSNAVGGDDSWIVRRSANNGSTWTNVDAYQLEAGKSASSLGMAEDPDGILWMTGWGTDNADSMNWVTRKSTDSGATWELFDAFQLNVGFASSGRGLEINAAGHIYLAGEVRDSAGNIYSMIRKSTDKGLSFLESSELKLELGGASGIRGVTIDKKQNAFTIGFASKTVAAASSNYWVTRKEIDNSGLLEFVEKSDVYQLIPGKNALGLEITIDNDGNLYALGHADDAADVTHIIVRKSIDNGTTWTTDDQFEMGGTTNSSGIDIEKDPRGNIYVVGQSLNAEGVGQATIRKLACEYVPIPTP